MIAVLTVMLVMQLMPMLLAAACDDDAWGRGRDGGGTSRAEQAAERDHVTVSFRRCIPKHLEPQRIKLSPKPMLLCVCLHAYELCHLTAWRCATKQGWVGDLFIGCHFKAYFWMVVCLDRERSACDLSLADMCEASSTHDVGCCRCAVDRLRSGPGGY